MNAARLAVLALALPVTLAAQQPSATPANPITAAFTGRIMGLQRVLAQAFDSIPESNLSYRPTPAQLTLGYIAQHLAEDNYLFCSQFGAPKPTLAGEDTATADSVKATWPKAKLVSKLKASFDYCEGAMKQLTDASLGDQVDLTYGGRTRKVSRANMVLGHALDLADHYSQVANYMRLNGMLPPTALSRR